MEHRTVIPSKGYGYGGVGDWNAFITTQSMGLEINVFIIPEGPLFAWSAKGEETMLILLTSN